MIYTEDFFSPNNTYPDSDLVQLIDSRTNENVNYIRTNIYFDGTGMDITKIDTCIYRQKNNNIFYKKVFNDSDYISVKALGIIANDSGAKISNATILKKSLKLGLKISFERGIYYIGKIYIDWELKETYLKGFAEFVPSVGNDLAAIIDTDGDDFLIYKKFPIQNKIIISNLVFKSKNYSGKCFYSEPSSLENDFILVAKNVTFLNFEKAFYTDSYTTLCRLEDVTFSDNILGFYSGLASNMSWFKQIGLFGNKIGIRVGGVNTKLDEVQISLTYLGPKDPQENTYAIIANSRLQLSNVYQEEYGDYSGSQLSNKNIILKLEANYNDTTGFIINQCRFWNNYNSGQLEYNSEDFNVDIIKFFTRNDNHDLPEKIFNPNSNAIKGISVNGKNIFINNNTLLMNKNEFDLIDSFRYNTDLPNGLTISGISFHRVKINPSSWIHYNKINHNKENVYLEFGGAKIQKGENKLYLWIEFETANIEDEYAFILTTETNAVRMVITKTMQIDSKKVVSANFNYIFTETELFSNYFIGIEKLNSPKVIDNSIFSSMKSKLVIKPI